MGRYLASVLAVLASACARTRPPTISGGDLYAHVHELQTAGQATVGRVVIRRDQTLVTASAAQPFLVGQVIEHCKGGDPTLDVDCTLALLRGERFTVSDHAPAQKAPKAGGGEDSSGSMLASAVVIGLVVAAAGGLVYGVATCEFEGCKAVFGVPLVLIGGGSLFLLGRD